MANELHELRARLSALAPDGWEEQIAVCEAILRLAVGDLIATRRLALALLKLGMLDRADEVVQEALALHPNDPYLARRDTDIGRARHADRNEIRTKTLRFSVSSAPNTWIKAIYDDRAGWTDPEGTKTWISDPGRHGKDGQRIYTAARDPAGRPSWQVGEEAGIYFGATRRVPVLVEIVNPP